MPGHRVQAWRQRLVKAVLVLSDVLLALAVWQATLVLELFWSRGWPSWNAAGIAGGVAVWVALRALVGLYPGYGLDQVEELRRQTYALLVAVAAVSTLAVAFGVGSPASRFLVVLDLLVLVVLAPLVRYASKWCLMRAGLWGRPVVILTCSEFGERVATLLKREWGMGYRPVAVFGGRPATAARSSDYEKGPGERCLAEAMLLSEKHGVNSVILAMPHTRREHLLKIVDWASLGFRHVTFTPNLEGITNSAVAARDLAGVLGVEIRHNLLDPSVRRVKRALDLVATLVGGALILPLLAALFLLVRLESSGPVFYKAQRLGRDGKLFWCVKFRTMVPDAEAVLQEILREDPGAREEYARYHKLRKDPRVTRAGRFLRKTSLDELPQLWNVVKGEMSLVGPRPYLPRESGEIGATQGEILRVYPGITGPWQTQGRNRTSFGERVRIDAHYVRNWSVWLDVVIMARTVRTLVFDRGAY